MISVQQLSMHFTGDDLFYQYQLFDKGKGQNRFGR